MIKIINIHIYHFYIITVILWAVSNNLCLLRSSDIRLSWQCDLALTRYNAAEQIMQGDTRHVLSWPRCRSMSPMVTWHPSDTRPIVNITGLAWPLIVCDRITTNTQETPSCHGHPERVNSCGRRNTCYPSSADKGWHATYIQQYICHHRSDDIISLLVDSLREDICLWSSYLN